MDEVYAREYAALYRDHWWWRARERFVLYLLRRFLPDTDNPRILDVGCGPGYLLDRLAELGEPEGLEPDPEVLPAESAAAHTVHAVPFDDSFEPGYRYGRILMLDVLEHLPEPDAALGNVARLLDPGGVFVATVPAFNALWTQHDVLNRHYTRYRKGQLSSMVGRAGLTVVHARYFFHLLFFPKLVVRALERLRPRPPAPPKLPSKAVNRFWFGVCVAEQALTRRVRPPLGSSVVVVARAPSAGRSPRSG